MNFYKLPSILILLAVLFSCKKEINSSNSFIKQSDLIKYSKGLHIEQYENYSKVVVKTPYQKADEQFEYYLVREGFDTSELPTGAKTIQIPLKSVVVNSTTHIPMLELLKVENNLVGFPNTRYVSSEKTRKLIDKNQIKELGNDGSFNTEILLELDPDAVIAFSMSAANKSLLTIERSGIPLIYNGDWLEETPLGRAEWIKLFGALFDKNEEASNIFDQIEFDYNKAIAIAKDIKETPTILSGVMFKDIWNLPAGGSFVAQFLNDANTNYLWKDTEGKGSLQLSFEAVLDKGQKADIWIAPGHYETKDQLNNASSHYQEFVAFNNNNIYTFANKKGKTGGVIYYELAPTRPDLVLKDIIKIAHPTVLPNYEMTFFEKMK
ncbi:MAG: ABC transporter substrate-binding protein [Bacteroidetes bacterium MedPE-SWsnd-G1]|nr:MAG: ABC transporter substrate-binding protein [Bacteroidetes bacterium MedPE-SWsnd-G1]